MTESIQEKVKVALKNPEYKFRTVNGVAAEVGIDPANAKELIFQVDNMVHLHRRTKEGDSLYTTRDHYYQRASIWERIMCGVINRVY